MATQESLPETYTDQQEIEPWRQRIFDQLHDRYVRAHGQGEEGFGEAAVLKLIATTLTAGGLTGLAIWSTSVETTNTIESKGGTLTAVYTMPPEECHGGYDAIINAKAEFNTKIKALGLSIPTTNRASEELNGEMTAQICNTQNAAGQRETDPKTHHITVTIGAEDLTTKVWQKDPTDPKAWTSDVGVLKAVQKNFGNLVKTLPKGLDYKGGDAVTNVLRGQALLAASDVMSRACGNTAWQKLKPFYAEEIKKSVVGENNTAIGAVQITEEDVTVNLPETVNMENQYSQQFADLKKEATNKGNTFKTIDASKVLCRDTGVTVGSAEK